MADRLSAFRVAVVSGVIALMAFGVSAPAQAFHQHYYEPYRMLWTPGFGYTRAAQSSPGSTAPHFVDQTFQWTEWPSLARVDCPRTSCERGSYEHELRFFANQFGGRYCETNQPTENLIVYLPSGYYRDLLGSDPGEYSWGMPAWRLILDQSYSMYFQCYWTNGAGSSGYFNLTAQIGHSEPGGCCSDSNTYGDESTKPIPMVMGRAPVEHYWQPPWANNFSMDSTPGGPTTDWFLSSTTTATRPCNSTAYHAGCYWNIHPTANNVNSKIYLDVYADTFFDPAIGTASQYHEFVVRCPVANVDDCRFFLQVDAVNSSGAKIGGWDSGWITVPDDGAWWIIGTKTQGLPTGTVRWRFAIYGYIGGDFWDADYNAQYYHLPT